jgi:hypothetical protein
MDVSGLRTKVFPFELATGQWTWRAPIRARRGIAIVELRPVEKRYRSERSAKASGERHVRRMFSGIVIES